MKIATFIDFFINKTYFDDPAKLWRARLLVRASFLTSLFSTTYVWLSMIFDFEKSLYLMLFNVIGFLFLPFLAKTRLPLNWLGNFYVFVGAFAVIALTYFSGGVWSAVYPWIIAIPVLALLVVNRLSGIVWGSISFLFMLWYAMLAYKGVQLPTEYNTALHTEWYISVLPGLLLITLFIAFVFESIQSRALKSLEEKNSLLETQKETISRQSDKLESLIEEKDYIIRILAHDLRNPLANIKSVVNLMSTEDDEERQQEYINIINLSSVSAHNLIDRVLEMDALGQENIEVQLEDVDVCTTISEAIAALNDVAKKKQANILFEPEFKNCLVTADKTYLRQIFENLISNAIKFSEEGKNVYAVVSKESPNVKIKIIDEGPGISPEEEGKLFKKFSKLSTRPTAGESSTGLGLSLVKRYVELIGGKVWYESGANKGATFVIELPLAN